MTDEQIAVLAERFCATPLPESVCADLVAIKPGPGRSGTNLLTVAEAKQMLTAILTPTGSAEPEIPAGDEQRARAVLADEVERMNRPITAEAIRKGTCGDYMEAAAIRAMLAFAKPAASQSGGDALREAFSGHDRMDRATMDDCWRKGGWGHDVVANRTTVMRFIGTIDALVAALSHPTTTAADKAGDGKWWKSADAIDERRAHVREAGE